MVDLSEELTDQIILERVRTSAPHAYVSSALRESFYEMWHTMLFVYGQEAMARLHHAGGKSGEDAPHPEISIGDMLALGRDISVMEPLLMSRLGGSGTDSPLNLACGHMLWGDRKEGETLLEQLRGHRWKSHTILGEAEFYSSQLDWMNPTSPEMFDAEPYHLDSGEWRYGFRQLSWLDASTTAEVLRVSCNGHRNNLKFLQGMNVLHRDRWSHSAQRLAESYVRNESKARIPYAALALALRLCSERFFISYVSQARGSRKALGVVRACDDDLFRQGLGRLMTPNILEALAPWVARPLELEDLTRLSGPGLAQFLWELPWEIVKPLADHHRSKVIPKTVSALSKPDYREVHREMLTNHPKRRGIEDGTAPPQNDGDWEFFIRPVIKQYMAARAFRDEVLAAGVTRDQLAFLLLTREEPHLKKVGETFPAWELMQTFLKKIPKHI